MTSKSKARKLRRERAKNNSSNDNTTKLPLENEEESIVFSTNQQEEVDVNNNNNNNNNTPKKKKKKQNNHKTPSNTDGGNNEPKTTSKSSSSSSSKLPQNTTTTTTTIKASSQLLGGKQFLTPQDGDLFKTVLHDNYQGFIHVPTNSVDSSFHNRSKAVLERLRDANYYQYDVVMAGGKHSSRTFVKRTLVGEPGITYKYLGLRLFAHAWSGPGVLPAMKAVGDMNNEMIQMTPKQYNNNNNSCGKYKYNLTLINYMEPTSHTKIGFKEEANYGMGKVSVSWHADSSLELNSSIGVYHCLPTQKRTARWDWRIALRRAPDSGEDAKDVVPIAVPTKDGDAYFLLGTFNETHQHCVLAGSEATRISSTHRVAVTKEDTYDYILRRVKGGSKRFRLELQKEKPSDIDPRVVVHCQKILTQVEMEWIAQYWLQGAEHDKMHVWWQKPMKTLEAFWLILEESTRQLFEICQQHPAAVRTAAIEGFLDELKNRQELREKWDERRADKIYQRRITPPFRPVARPAFGESKKKVLGKDLTTAIDTLSQILESKTQEEKGTRKTASENNSTKKRKKGDTSDEHGVQLSKDTKRNSNSNSNNGNNKSLRVEEKRNDGPNGKKKKKQRKT